MTFVRFLCSGGLNTAVTYLLYLLGLTIMPYWAAYTGSYVIGIAMMYVMNRYWVFKQHRGVASAVLLPLVYGVQYVVGLIIVWAWVDAVGLDERYAPLGAILVTVPATYVLSKLVFITKR